MITVREAKIDDLEEVVRLFDAYRVWYRVESDLKNASSFISARMLNKESMIYIAIDATEKAVGFVQLYPSFSSVSMTRLWILNDLFVNEESRGKGISKLLIYKAKQWCKITAGSGVLLETEASNTIGNALYPSQGFKLAENNFYFWSEEE